MYHIIAPTLFHNKICILPGIGTLVMVLHGAATDFVNGRIRAPFETIDFTATAKDENLSNEFSAMSKFLLQQLTEIGSVVVPSVGTFTKVNNGEVEFTSISVEPVFIQPVEIERVIRQDASHAILVGDQQTTNVEMSGFFSEQKIHTDRWWIWAVVLAAVGIGALIVYFYLDGTIAFGNSSYY